MARTKRRPKKLGRPPVSDEDRRDRRLDDVRFSARELAGFKAQAAKAGLRWSDFVRLKLSA